jgi:SAM-dependent methyltransferase
MDFQDEEQGDGFGGGGFLYGTSLESVWEGGMKTINGKDISLDGLDMQQLDKLHFEQECAYAKAIRLAPPFSEERAKLVRDGYSLVHQFEMQKQKLRGETTTHFGANPKRCAGLLRSLALKMLKNKPKIHFFEAGVGGGAVLLAMAKMQGIDAWGVDAVRNPHLDSSLHVIEGDICFGLEQMPDASIDLFYWNDVLEHMLDDEAPRIFSLIRQKMAPGGIAVTITPNRLSGPHDITGKMGGKVPLGFHFHEYSFTEVCALWNSYGFQEWGTVLRTGLQKYSWLPVGFPNSVKRRCEPLVKPFPRIIRKVALVAMASEVFVCRKEGVI